MERSSSESFENLVAAAQANVAELAGQIDALAHASPSHDLSAVSVAKRLYRLRRARTRYFQADVFGEPGWDILLDLYIARSEGRTICTTSACIAASVPATTGLRWLGKLERKKLIRRYPAKDDDRMTLVEIDDEAFDRLTSLLTSIG